MGVTNLNGHFLRIRIRPNNLVFIADMGPLTPFISQKTANLITATVKAAKRMQTNENNEANRMVCYNGLKIPSFGGFIAPIESGIDSQHSLTDRDRGQASDYPGKEHPTFYRSVATATKTSW